MHAETGRMSAPGSCPTRSTPAPLSEITGSVEEQSQDRLDCLS